MSEEGQDYMHPSADAGGSQERVLDPSQLELEVIVSQRTQMLGKEPGSSAEAAFTRRQLVLPPLPAPPLAL